MIVKVVPNLEGQANGLVAFFVETGASPGRVIANESTDELLVSGRNNKEAKHRL